MYTKRNTIDALSTFMLRRNKDGYSYMTSATNIGKKIWVLKEASRQKKDNMIQERNKDRRHKTCRPTC
jgi:hypothetical protein